MLVPESERLLRDRSYRIDVVKINAIHFIDAGIDVARHCDIDDEKRAIHTLPQHRCEFVRRQQGHFGRCRSDENIDLAALDHPLVERNDGTATDRLR